MKKRKYIFLLIIILACSFSYPIFAEDINDINTNTNQNSINELQTIYGEVREQANEANEQLENVQTDLSETMQQIQNLNERIDEYQSQIDSLGKDADSLKISIGEIEKELSVAQENYKEKKESLEQRLVVLYETGQTTYLDVLLNSKNISDFISRYYLIKQITEYDANILNEAESQKNRVEIAKETLDNQVKKYKTAKDNAEKTAILLENTRIVKNNYINKLTDQEKELQNKIEEYTRQIKQIEAEIVLLTTANIGSDYVGGSFAWPIPGYTRITSAFGMRTHPITGVYKLHTGTDISAPMGANFIAMNSGVVIKAAYNTAYGNMVIIDHGGGVATLYAHGSEILVNLGQTVNRGDPVLKVGDTGYSTAPHAHFEIRINGEYVDPMKFVTPES